MITVLAMIFTMHTGLGATPIGGAVTSLRQEALAVAAQQAERDSGHELAPGAPAAGGPAIRVVTREQWRGMLLDLLPGDRLASAAIWMMDQPVSVDVSGDKVFVSLRVGPP
jgi:hypothetical protein